VIDGSVALITVGAGGSFDTEKVTSPVVGFILDNKGLMYNLTLEARRSAASAVEPDPTVIPLKQIFCRPQPLQRHGRPARCVAATTSADPVPSRKASGNLASDPRCAIMTLSGKVGSSRRRIDRFRDRKRLAARGRGLAQLVRDIHGSADRHDRGRLQRADLADHSAASMYADCDLHLAVPLSSEPLVEVGGRALDRSRRLQGLSGGLLGRALEPEQRADAVELDIAERAAGPSNGIAECLDIERQHVEQILRSWLRASSA
jgi:hypothetical protein